MELVGRVDARELGNALDSATRKRLTAVQVVCDRLVALGRQGRPGVAGFDELRKLGAVQSWLERKFLKLVDGCGLPRPVLQRTYYRDHRHVARVDFDFAPAPVVVEVGGSRGYLSLEERRRQEHRRNELQLLGRTIYFCSTEDVVSNPNYVTVTVRAAIAAAA